MMLGFVMAWLVSQIVNLPAAVTWWSILLGFGFSVMVGIFSDGIQPAVRHRWIWSNLFIVNSYNFFYLIASDCHCLAWYPPV
jgi:hypothetical protein